MTTVQEVRVPRSFFPRGRRSKASPQSFIGLRSRIESLEELSVGFWTKGENGAVQERFLRRMAGSVEHKIRPVLPCQRGCAVDQVADLWLDSDRQGLALGT